MNTVNHKAQTQLAKDKLLQILAGRLACPKESLEFMFETCPDMNGAVMAIPDHRLSPPPC